MEKKSSNKGNILFFIIAALFLAGGLFLGVKGRSLLSVAKGEKTAETNELNGIEADVSLLRQEAYTLKDDIRLYANLLLSAEVQGAQDALERIDQDTATLQEHLDQPIWKLAGYTPVVGSEVSSVRKLMDIMEDVSVRILHPFTELTSLHPLKDIKVGESFNAALVYPYIDFLQEIAPSLEEVCEEMKTLDLDMVDKEGKVSGYTQKLSEVLELYHEYKDFLPLMNTILGAKGDRVYVLAAQNSAEIRSTGGFPGAIGSLRIENGLMSFGEFESVYDALPLNTPTEANILPDENRLFSDGMFMTHDAGFCPDYERAASIWALGYSQRKLTRVDGIISMTPVMIQRFLKVLGSITLTDRKELTAENATRYLQYDIYFKYLGWDMDDKGLVVSDRLFYETARKTFKLISSTFSLRHLTDYFDIFREGIADRTILLWMSDAEEQALVRKAGWAGTLNDDPRQPEAGIYYNLYCASKLGWFLDINTDIGEPVTNPDGSETYHISVSLVNTLTAEEIDVASDYILGLYRGTMVGALYLFAPAGGTVENVVSSAKETVYPAEYKNLKLQYCISALAPGSRWDLSYDLTTAPGVSEALRLSTTPTLQNYR